MIQYSVPGPEQRCYRGLSIVECFYLFNIGNMGSSSILCHCWWLQNSTRMYEIEVVTGLQNVHKMSSKQGKKIQSLTYLTRYHRFRSCMATKSPPMIPATKTSVIAGASLT